MSETGKSSGKVETLNRSLIDRIVERERTLPGLDAVDPAWKADVDRRWHINAETNLWTEYSAHLLYYWGYEGYERWTRSLPDRTRESPGREQLQRLKEIEASEVCASPEIALAYAYCIEARPEIWAFVPLARRADDLELEIEAEGQMSVYDWQLKYGFDYGIPDFLQYRHLFYCYARHFKYQYGQGFTYSSIMESNATTIICGSPSAIGEEEFLSFYESHEKRNLVIDDRIRQAKDKAKAKRG